MSTQHPITWTREERALRLWMLISTGMYLFGAAFFLLFGAYIPEAVNLISSALHLPMPLYPLPLLGHEGAFWRVLSVSMMFMLAWICGAAYADPRANANLVPVLLVSKFCSTSVYFVLFLKHGYLAYIIGSITDGPIFVLSLYLWFRALPGENHLAPKEEQILVALGNAILPQGGAFSLGYLDLREETLADTHRMFAAFDGITLLGMRLILRLFNFAPLLTGQRAATLLMLDEADRQTVLARIETHRWAWVRALMLVLKVHVAVPFFNQTAAAQAVGYRPEAPTHS